MQTTINIDKIMNAITNKADILVKRVVEEVMDAIHEIPVPIGDPSLWKRPNNAPPGYVGGHFKKNWQLKIDSESISEIEGHDYQGVLESEKAKIPTKAANVKYYYYANPTPYAYDLEYGRYGVPHSSQAPNGMVRLTAQEFPSIVQKVLQELK